MSDTPKAPAIETLAQRITVARKALAQATAERDNAHQQVRAWTEKADIAGESVTTLESRLATLCRMITDEANR